MEQMASRILVVEDEALISEMVAEELADRGFEVYAVSTAREAIEHLTCGAPCDCLFTDINLPGGTDGAALARQARALRPGLPVVYASGAVRRLGDLDAVPGATFVAKPYDLKSVCVLLSRVAGGH